VRWSGGRKCFTTTHLADSCPGAVLSSIPGQRSLLNLTGFSTFRHGRPLHSAPLCPHQRHTHGRTTGAGRPPVRRAPRCGSVGRTPPPPPPPPRPPPEASTVSEPTAAANTRTAAHLAAAVLMTGAVDDPRQGLSPTVRFCCWLDTFGTITLSCVRLSAVLHWTICLSAYFLPPNNGGCSEKGGRADDTA